MANVESIVPPGAGYRQGATAGLAAKEFTSAQSAWREKRWGHQREDLSAHLLKDAQEVPTEDTQEEHAL